MKTSTAQAIWQGNLHKGSGKVKINSTGYETPYNFVSRFENGTDTNPEELIAAAHAACFSMALSHQLNEKGFEPEEVTTKTHVHLDQNEKGFYISEIVLSTTARVKNLDEKTFLEIAGDAKVNCPVSRALSAVKISLKANLL